MHPSFKVYSVSLKRPKNKLPSLFKKYGLHILSALLLIISFFYNSGQQALLADEPTRALNALEIMLRQNPIPTINGEIYLNKPPLYNWMLIPFYKAFGFDEAITRLPAILSLLILGFLVFYFNRKFTGDFDTSFFVAIAFLTSGNLFFYSSLLGHIDATFSIFMFLLFMLNYQYGKQGNWNALFRWCYILCFIGFMLKGIPALVFVAITLLVTAIFFKRFKVLFSASHFLNMLWLFVPVALYFWAFSYYYPLDEYFLNLWSESSKRTVMEKSFLESIQHIFVFPFQFVLDTAPWSFLVFIFFIKKCRNYVWNNEYLRYSLLVLVANIAIYWLAPDNRARYVMMLYPLFFTVVLFAFTNQNLMEKKWARIAFKWFPMVLPILLIGAYFIHLDFFQAYRIELIVLVVLAIILAVFTWKSKQISFFPLLFFMLILRLGFDLIAIPDRVITGGATVERCNGNKIAEITQNEPLSMFCSNLQHSTTFYITEQRQQILPITNAEDKWDANSFYLTPTALITDTANTTVFFEFERRHQNTPFSLVKFNKGFPKVPK